MMITKFKIFENVDIDDYSTWKMGDTVYCINDAKQNKSISLIFGEKYKLEGQPVYISKDNEWEVSVVFSFYNANRFTKNPNHPILLQKRFDL